MFSMNIQKLIIRRTYVLKANGCGLLERSHSPVVTVCKMLQTFEELVFEQTDKKCIASTKNCDNKCPEGKTVQTNNKNKNMTFNKINENRLSDQNYCAEYEEAIKALNSLQSNAEALRSPLHKRARLNSVQDTQRYLLKSGLAINDLEKLSYIHISGTKGKGSTCALTDSILRSYGVKTGFFSSPHLVSLTERLRINGQPISKEKFTKYFWPLYNKLNSLQDYENDMPAYFKFLTVLAFHVYLAEKVDVVILEVGIGGELDCTNVVANTKTIGITSLGLEHTELLGNTLKEIAWQKAGIIKPRSTVYTSVTQEECWQVIKQRAEEKQAVVYRVPKFESYFQDSEVEHIKNQLNNCAVLNGSLAIQLAYDWLRQNCNGFHKNYEINKPHLTQQAIEGILNCNWPGRCQSIEFFNFKIHLDGAHTEESMQVCGNWFAQATINSSQLPKILIFNITGNRDAKILLTTLRKFSKFDFVCFVPNIVSLSNARENQDNKSVLHSQVEQMQRVQLHSISWNELCEESKETNNAKMFLSIVQCFQHIRKIYDKSQDLNILVTGSIHLIGATILALNEMYLELNKEYT